MSAADELAAIAHLDFPPAAPRCELIDVADLVCVVAAEWVWLCEMCDRPGVFCCHEDRRMLDEQIKVGGGVTCPGCGTVSSIAHPRHRFEPVGVAR